MVSGLKISEMFISIQGEGQTIGIPALFIRLTACNLDCSWCDTVEVWRTGKRYSYETILTNMVLMDSEIFNKLGAREMHVVITGGEPLLQMDNIVEFLTEHLPYQTIVEIETSGTIIPSRGMFSNVEYWNVSPKTPNSGHIKSEFMNEDAIDALLNADSIFKFVVDMERDITQIMGFYGQIPNNRIYLMPQSQTRKELQEKSQKVTDLSIKYGMRFSTRLQLSIWNEKTGK